MKKYFSPYSFVVSFIACAVFGWITLPLLFFLITTFSYLNKRWRDKSELAKSYYLMNILFSLVLGCLLVSLINWMSAQ